MRTDKLAATFSTASLTMGIFNTLRIHPDAHGNGIASLIVEVTLMPDAALQLDYTLTGDPAALRLQAAVPPARADELWRHTCFEAFIRSEAGTAYREFNFSPSGQWQTYAFADYRSGDRLEPASPPHIVTQRQTESFRLQATIASADLPQGERLRIGLSTVIEHADGLISYWALQHPPGKPDFHHPDTFALEINTRCHHP